MPIDMTKALRQAALVRNLIETTLKGASAPMTGRELANWPTIQEQIGTSTSGYSRLSTQLQQMVKRKLVDKIGQGPTTTYCWHITPKEGKPSFSPSAELRLNIDRQNHSLTFTFEGLKITIQVTS